MKDRRTSKGEIFEVNMEIKMKRDDHNAVLMDYMNEFDDVTIGSIE